MRGLNLIIIVITALVVTQLDSGLAIYCYSCVSTGNENCITNGSSQTSIPCDNGNCFTATYDNATVARGCLATEATCPDSKSCQTCNTDKCNNNAVCYNCTGDSCNTVATTMLTACGDNSKCYTTGSSAANMTRGCTADTTPTYKCAAGTTDTSCVICEAGQCNNLAYERTEGSCITCTGCLEAQETDKSAPCKLLYNQTATGCYTTTAGARGCLADLESGCTDENTCKSCTGDNCNNAGQEFQCIKCLSNEVSGCWSGTGTDLPTVACPNGTCFSGIWNGLGIRNCLTAGSELMQYQCMNKVEPYQCETCTTPTLCNSRDFNGAGSLSQMGVIGLFLCLLVVLRSA